MAVRWAMMVQSLSRVTEAEGAGFDCVQPTVGFILDLQKRRIKNPGVPFEVSPVPLPADVRVTERGFNLYAWMEDLKKSLQGLSDLGCKKLAWSEGRARLLPLEGDRSGAKEQAMQFLYMLCDAAAEKGMTVLIEPLGPRRTNFLNTLDEIRDFLPRVGKENLSAMISLRELEATGLTLASLPAYKDLIAHVQMENPLSPQGARTCPRASDGYDYRSFLGALETIGYSGVITRPEDADTSGLSYCKEMWKT